MTHPFVNEWRDIPPRSGPWMDRDPQPPMCRRCQTLHDADTARLRGLLHQLTDYNDRLRAENERLERDLANVQAANAALRRHEGINP